MCVSSKVAIQSRYTRDRNVVLLLVGLVWLAIGAGFGPDIATHILSRASPYPLIVHAHALAFVGWLVLLTGQVLYCSYATIYRNSTASWALAASCWQPR